MSQFSNEKSAVKPPLLANQLMALLLPKRVVDNIIGDLEEEFYLLARKDIQRATQWYWQQSIETSMLYLRNKMGSVEVLGRLNFYLPLAMFLVVAGLIVILSNLEDPAFISPTFWSELLEGKIHTALFSENFWQNFWGILSTAELALFFHPQSLVIATINILILVYLDKRQQASVIKLAVWGYSLAFIPYIWSIVHIASHSFEAKQIGPIIATGIISLLYMLLPTSFIIHRKLKHRQAELRQFEKDKMAQESNQDEQN